MFHPFSSKWSFISNVKEKQPFIECLQRLKPISKKVNNKEVKPRKDHQLCTEIFCTERGCIDTFETFEQLNEHILNGIHHIPKVETYDHVKKYSPDEVHIAMRQKLSIDLYCSITQIRSLFSRWSLEL